MKMRLTATLLLIILSAAFCKAQNPTLWGMCSFGGTSFEGTIFNYNIAEDTLTVALNFDSLNGSSPIGKLIQGSNGLLYGLTSNNGVVISSVLFSLNPITGADSVLCNFNDRPGIGSAPGGSLLQVGDTLYGTCSVGGVYGTGLIFKYYNLVDSIDDVHNFEDQLDTSGQNPFCTLIQANNGLLYGTAFSGGIYNEGIIFSYNITTGAYKQVYSFKDTLDGTQPQGALMQATNGLIYGITTNGGTGDNGALFSFNPVTDSETVLHNFDPVFGGFGGLTTVGPGYLIQVGDSLLYGLAAGGALNSAGAIFTYNMYTGVYLVLHNFGFGTDGSTPGGGLVEGPGGILYGTTTQGGANAAGTIFSYNPATGSEKVVHSFDAATGAGPQNGLILVNMPITGIPAIAPAGQLQIYPNPTTGQFAIQLPNTQSSYPVEIYNTLGQKIEQLTLTGTQNTITLNNQPTGVYFVNVITDLGRVAGKVIVAM